MVSLLRTGDVLVNILYGSPDILSEVFGGGGGFLSSYLTCVAQRERVIFPCILVNSDLIKNVTKSVNANKF